MKSTVLLLFYLLVFSAASPAQFRGAEPDQMDPIDSLLQEASAKKLFSGNVLIEENGKTRAPRKVGMADYENHLPNKTETQFSIGSITKLFTRIMVIQLVSEGKISLSDKLGKYLSGFQPDVAERVTVAQLLDHQSGLGQYYETPDFDPEGAIVNSSTDFLPWIRSEKLAFEPGSRTAYSNSGYIVLGAIIEKVEGKTYPEVLKTRVLDKIGMKNTGFSFQMKKIPGKAIGYLSNQPGPLQNNLGMAILGGGDGGIYANVSDLQRLSQSLIYDNRLLSDADKVRLVNEPLFPRQYKSWEEFCKDGRFALAGGAPGVSAVLGINMEKKRTVIVLSNFDEGSAEAIFQRVKAILDHEKPEPLQPSPAIFIYNLLTAKGAAYFKANIDRELKENGYNLGDDDMPLLFAGQPLLAEGKADEAIALYQYYTAQYPRIVVAWNDLGDAYLLKKDKENAKYCFKKALEIRPGNVRAKESLGKL